MGTGVQPWLGSRLGALAVPTLVVAGARDPKFAAIARTLAAAIPAATLAIVAGAGHAVHLEAAAAFTALVRTFLDQGKEDRCRSTG
jgi:2-succinyl-6-hydroxy-2,4-cyclohexadiene-1-carboxylate synthase